MTAPFDSADYDLAPPQTAPHPHVDASDGVLRVLIDARALIADPNVWVPFDPVRDAEQHCALSACGAANNKHAFDPDILMAATDYLGGFLPSEYARCQVWMFNDGSTHADVLDLFDRAISSRRAELAGART